MRYQLGELSLGGILDQAIALMKNHFKPLFLVTCYLFIPFSLIQSFVATWLTPTDMANSANATMEQQVAMLDASMKAAMVGVPLGIFLMLAVYPITNAALIRLVGNEYLGRPASPGSAMREGARLWLPLVGTAFIAYIFIGLGFLLLVIPGIYLSLRYWFTTQVVVLENVRYSAALKRSGALMKGNMGTAFVLGFLIGIISLIAQSVAAMVPYEPLAIVVQVVITAALTVFSSAASVVFYFSCRCKVEHFDLTLLAEAMEAEESPAIAEAR